MPVDLFTFREQVRRVWIPLLRAQRRAVPPVPLKLNEEVSEKGPETVVGGPYLRLALVDGELDAVQRGPRHVVRVVAELQLLSGEAGHNSAQRTRIRRTLRAAASEEEKSGIKLITFDAAIRGHVSRQLSRTSNELECVRGILVLRGRASAHRR